MQCNIGKTDRTVRITAGALIILAGLVYHSWWGLLGIIPLATGYFRWCPPYEWFGINTNKS